MRRRNLIRSSRFAGAVLVALAVAACSGGGSPSARTASDPLTGAVASSAPASGTPASGASDCSNPAGADLGATGVPLASMMGQVLCGMPDIDPCSMVTQAEVQALFSVPLGTYTTDHTGDCTWPLSDSSVGDGLDVFVNVGQGEGPLDQDMGLSDLTPISGIGDHASWGLLAGYFPHLGAVKGQDTCELTVGGGNGQLSVPTTGKGVFAKIDDAALPGLMQQLGALCTEIFGKLGA